jgi:predicted ABC-type ATPase
MFAGPNGSGKSTLKSFLPRELLGIYLNPDEIEQDVHGKGFLDFDSYSLNTTGQEVLPFLRTSRFLHAEGFGDVANRISFDGNRLDFSRVEMNSYFASVLSDFIRQELLKRKASFTFETVMSHPDKVALLGKAQQVGYRTYLYYVATEDPAINISRVRSRVKAGGHSVPEERIEKRYYRSLDLLIEAIRCSNRAYIFDNSTDNERAQHTWVAEVTDGHLIEVKTEQVPAWFQRAVLDKIALPPR